MVPIVRFLIRAAKAVVACSVSRLVEPSPLAREARWLGSPLPLLWALAFGALISPTDPVAVLSTLKAVNVPEALEVEMSGEALLNDGVGVVIFTILVAAAVGGQGSGKSP